MAEEFEDMEHDEGMDMSQVLSHVVLQLEEAEDWNHYLSADRQLALDYYDGETPDIKTKPGRSSQVSSDLRTHYGKLRPSIMRTLFGGGGIVEYEPLRPDQETMAKDASDYVNRVVLPEAKGEEEILNSIFDSMILRTGVLTWGVKWEQEIDEQEFFNQPQEVIEGVIEQEGVEIDIRADNEDGTFDGVMTVTKMKAKPFIEAVRRSSFLIHPHCATIQENKLVGRHVYYTRSELVSMGIDRNLVDALRASEVRAESIVDSYGQYDQHGEFEGRHANDGYMPTEEILVRDLYVQLDMDGDGITERYNILLGEGGDEGQASDGMFIGEGVNGYTILKMDRADETPFAKITIEDRPYQFEGHSLADDLMEIQRIKTRLTRDTADNVFDVANPRTFVRAGAVQNPKTLIHGDSSAPILLKKEMEGTVRDAVYTHVAPSIAGDVLAFMDRLDQEATDRTGVSDLSGAVDPEKLTAMSATGASIVSQAGQERAEMYLRTLAQGGLRDALGGLLKMTVLYADQEREVRIDGQWRKFQPQSWDWRMKCVVNVGMGTGSRSADLQALMIIRNTQAEIIQRFGPFNPWVTPQELANTDRKIIQLTGVADPSRYIRTPTDEELQAFMQQAQEQAQHDPEGEKDSRQAELKQAEFQFKAQMAAFDRETQLMLEERKQQTQANRELAQLEADTVLRTTEAELQALADDRAAERQRRLDEFGQQMEALKLSMQEEQHDDDIELRRDELALRYAG